MRSTVRAVVIALAVVAVAGWAAAQGGQQQYPQPPSMQQGMMQKSGQYQPVLQSADQLLGIQIQNNQGESLGRLEDIVLEPGLNYVAYGVLSRGGVMGMGEDYFAIPWDVLQLGSDRQNLILNIPQQAFEQAQGFSKDRWPDRADQRWRMQAMGQQPIGGQQPMQPGEAWREEQSREQHQWRQQQGQQPAGQQPGESWREEQYREQQQWRQQQPQAMSQQQQSRGEVYGRPTPRSRDWESDAWQQTPRSRAQAQPGGRYGAEQGVYGDTKEGFNFRRVSQLLDLDVQTFGAQQNVGDLKDIVLDFQQGLVAYGIISVANGNAPVPWSAIEIRPMDRVALVDATEDTLNQVTFRGDQLPDLSNPQYAQNIHEQFNREPYWEVLGFVGGPQGQRVQPQSMRPQSPTEQPMQQQSVQQGMRDTLKQHFDAQNLTVISGTVQSVGTFDDPQLGIHGERLRIMTDDGQTVAAHVGTRQFLEQQGLTLRRNDQVQLRGSFATINGRSVFIASDIRTPQKEVQLRDQQGNAMWGPMDVQ